MTPPARIKRSNTAVESDGNLDKPDESRTKKKKEKHADPVEPPQPVEANPKTAVKAKAKKKLRQPETPEHPKLESTSPDPATVKAVQSSLQRMPTVDGAKETKPNDSDKKDKGGDKTETAEDASSSSDDEETIAKKAEEVRVKREAHARFMRFSRSLTRF